MYEILSIVLLAVLFAGCSAEGGTANTNTANDPDLLIGGWLYEYPATGCQEILVFNGDATFLHASLDGVSSGTWSTRPYQGGATDYLDLMYTETSSGSDCEGDVLSYSDGPYILRFSFSAGGTLVLYSTSDEGEFRTYEPISTPPKE